MEQILREQILELTKLLELKDKRIKELEALISIPGITFPVIPNVGKNEYTFDAPESPEQVTIYSPVKFTATAQAPSEVCYSKFPACNCSDE